MTLLGWRQGASGRALWWRGSRVMLVQITTGMRQTSQWFESEASALHALGTGGVQWTVVPPPKCFDDGA